MRCSRAVPDAAQLLTAVLAASADLVIVTDEDGTITAANDVADRLLDGTTGRSILDVAHPDDRDGILEVLAAHHLGLAARTPSPATIRALDGDGCWVALEVVGVERVGRADAFQMVLVLRDASVRAETEHRLDRTRAELDYAVSHDAVTTLPNRLMLEQRVDVLCGQRLAGGCRHLVMVKVADVDALRDRYGARETESILRALGCAVRGVARPGDFVAVDGTGEFVVLTEPGLTTVEVDLLARRLLALAGRPLSSRATRAEIRLAAGVTRLGVERGAADTLDQLGRAARTAASAGIRTPVVYDGDVHHVAARRRLVADVERALRADEFELYYQPIRDVRSSRIAGFEGLLRWNHPTKGVLPAADFLPAVEGTALIVDIGDFVLVHGCRQLARWQQRFGSAAPMLALNISARQLREGDFAERVAREVAIAGIDAGGLCFELTETHALEHEHRAVAELQALRELGATVALDDFGTGYSSLHHLQEIGADVLKIERAFISKLGTDAGATAIVRAAIELGGAFGMTTVAEGVTTVEQHRQLLALGCDRIQGFLIAPALAPELAEAMVDAEPADRPTVGVVDAERRLSVLRAYGELADIDDGYRPSEDEVAAIAGVTALQARRDMTFRPTRDIDLGCRHVDLGAVSGDVYPRSRGDH